MGYDAVLFDLDGTLVDSLPDIAATANRTLAAFGLPPLDVETVRGFVGYGVKHLVEGCFAGRIADTDEALRVFRQFYLERPCERTRAYPAVRETLDALAGVSLAIVTNKPQAVSEAVLEQLGLRHYFTLIVGGDALPLRKPDPLPIVHVMERLGSTATRTILVGDGIPDAQAGRAAGVAVCLVGYGYASRAELTATHPDFFIERFAELLPIVRNGDHPTSP
ncbi:MAG: phosphoglycolate phosphatase [Planctomycetes bacterium]|nr:phosphoglycolate phosphatase [Planctomycetota bacterium]MBI3848038.1 phosphoglycolate phosphatase [Planctomycetota bacterium]